MKINFFKKTFAAIMIVAAFGTHAQNVFLDRNFWNAELTVKDVQQKINEGNDPSELNANSFDPVVYATNGGANLDVIKFLLSQEGNSVTKITHDGRTYLFWAAYRGNLPLVKHLLNEGAAMNVVDDHGYSVMNFAANAGQTDKELYDVLIAAGADVKAEKNRKGANTLLLLVPHLKSMDMVKYFEEKGLSIKDMDDEGNNAFNYAARTGNIAMMDLLIAAGLEHKGLNKEGGNAMLFAAEGTRGVTNSLAVYQYLEKKGVKPNVTTKSGTTPLHILAARSHDLEVFKYFEKKGVDANQKDHLGNNPLMIAAFRNDLNIVQFLAAQTKDINTTNEKGETALNRAVEGNTSEVVNYLLAEGATTNEMTGKALIASYRKGKVKELEAKLAAIYVDDFNPSAVQESGNTLLHYAVEHDDAELIKIVLKWEMDVNAKNDEGYTALHIAAMKASNAEVLQYLVENGADVNTKTGFDESAYDLASENELLAKKGADIDFLKS